eukprot:TRINITY_DN11014_c0_g1_i1.p1 TRINITY_DN11014_c0_g1~~TRINITY_DN11014_c0_g1_i1.p1  ORF type:complete len:298 (+),score=51.95 TRINITY_DN11014_c0_g1_i1:126-896(+)
MDEFESYPWSVTRFRHTNDEVGDIVVVDAPTRTHQVTASRLVDAIADQLNALPGVPADTFVKNDCPTTTVGLPDGSITASGKPSIPGGGPGSANARGSPWPNVVVEVGWSQELNDIRDKCREWLNGTTVQVAILIKIRPQEWRHHTNTNRLNPAMPDAPAPLRIPLLLELWRRNAAGVPHATHSYDFGTGGQQWNAANPNCSAPGLPAYTFTLSKSEIYFGDPAATNAAWYIALVDPIVSVDLFQLRAHILRYYPQ